MTIATGTPRLVGRALGQRRLLAIASLYALNRAMFGSWYPSVATIKTELHLRALDLSGALFCLPAGLVVGAITTRLLALTAAPPLAGLVASEKGLGFALGALAVMAVVALALSGSLRYRLPPAGLMCHHGRVPLGRALAQLRAMADAAAPARARLRLTAEAVRAGASALTVDEVRRPKVVDIEDELRGGLPVVRPQRASALRRRRDRSSMLALVELPGRVLAIEVVRVGTGARRFVVWNISSTCTVSSHERAGDALGAFEAVLAVEWRRIWQGRVMLELAALPAQVAALRDRRPRRAPMCAFTTGEGGVAELDCPPGGELQRRRRATVWAVALPGGQVMALRWSRLSRHSPPQLALLDSRQAGERVRAFTGDLGGRLRSRLEPFETPYWLTTGRAA